MPTYRELKAEIQRLQAEAEQARLAEKAAVLDTIRAMIIEYRLLPPDLGFTTEARTGNAPGAAKYRDPATGATWSGRGRAPAWLAGTDRSRFEIKERGG